MEVSESVLKLVEARSPYDKQFLEAQIATTGRELYGLVYELYGLTEEANAHKCAPCRSCHPSRRSG